MQYKRTMLPPNGNWICRACGKGNLKALTACAFCLTKKE